MHTILLLYRSVVLAAATPDGGEGGGASGAGGDGVGKPALDFATHATKREGPTLDFRDTVVHGAEPDDADAVDDTSLNLLNTRPSVSRDIEWVAAQASADAEAAAAIERKEVGTAVGIAKESFGYVEGGDGATRLTPEQVQSAHNIAEQLDTEVRQRVQFARCRW